MRAIKWLVLSILLTACGPNEGVLRSGKGNSESANSTPVVTLESDIEEVRNANCRFIYVLRRKDGGEIEAEDRSFLRSPTADAKRRMLSDGGKAIVIGSDFQIPPDKIPAIYDRFAVEDHSAEKPRGK